MSEDQSAASSLPQRSPVPAKNLSKRQIFLFVALCVVLAGGFLFYNLSNLANRSILPLPNSPFTPAPRFQGNFELKKFRSAEELQQYIQANQQLGVGIGLMERQAVAPAMPTNMVVEDKALSSTGQTIVDRYSGTNVQVIGIDEPDIVKTNGIQIFLSSERGWWDPVPLPMPMLRDTGAGQSGQGSSGMEIAPDAAVSSSMMKIAPGYPGYPGYQQPTTQIFNAFPPAELAKIGSIDTAGQLLLSGNDLVVFGSLNGQSVLTGFDIDRASAPQQLWQLKLQENNQLVTARAKDGKLYVITQSYLTGDTPCPYVPLIQTNGQQLTIPCTEIYYPDRPISGVDATFTAMIINPATGDVEKTTSFVGSVTNTIIYMSPNSLYLTYQEQADMVEFLYGFISEKGSDLFPTSVKDRLARLQSYDLSRQAKMVELQSILDSYQRSLNKDERLRQENELQNRMQDYLNSHSRELEQTLIVKLNVTNLSTQATGGVPGYLLNQFSMDEYQGNLRVATTFGQTWTQFGQAESASDVYVLDGSLQQRGVVTDLGKGERIYAVRFLDNKGYVVTFKQVDPFYVLDLSNPTNPHQAGELKIPGYSSYLHPIGTDRVVGIGMENNQVKVSLLDVSNPNSPQELSKYLLDEYWTEVMSTHHAFLLDDQHQVFFMPGSKGGYIFSYADDVLKLAKAVSQSQVKRALFINNYLFVIGDQGITVLNEADWQAVKELSW